MALYNRFSFIVFGDTAPEPADLFGLPLGGIVAPSCATVILTPGETYTFYLPFSRTIALNDSNFDLVSDKTKQVVSANIGQVTQVTVGTQRHFLASVTVPNLNIPEVYYRFRLHTTTGNVYSNRVWLVIDGVTQMSSVFSYRNDRPVGPIAYDLPALDTFRNTLRLKCFQRPAKRDTSLETQERERSGEKIVTRTTTHLYFPFSVPTADAIGAEGFATMLDHHDIQVNGRAVQLKTGYTESDDDLQTATFELWDSEFSLLNLC